MRHDRTPTPASAVMPRGPHPAGSPLLRHRKSIVFLTGALCLAGWYAALTLPASVFPQTDFPRVVILLDNGVMPADEMMATVTRPVEETMKDIPGTVNIRSATGRGSAEVNVFFDWSTDMVQAELYVLGRLSQIRSSLPDTVTAEVHRLTFSAFPILGVSLTSPARSITDLWETARYDIQPRLLRVPGVARIALVGGSVPEYHVVADPVKLEAFGLTIDRLRGALAESTRFVPAGMHEEDRQLYLAVVDSRVRGPLEIEDVVIGWDGESPIRVRDVASVRRGKAPRYNIVTADGKEAVLLNVYSQPDGNTLAIARGIREQLRALGKELSPDLALASFYDQSLFVREGLGSVWESIVFGLLLSVLVMFAFLRRVSTTLVAAAVIPVTVLLTLVGLRLFDMSFNLMTLGGIAAAIGLVIDDAIVMVEAIHTKVQAGHSPSRAAGLAIREVGYPLVGSTLTPVVVFAPLSLLEGVAGVFFRALALTMVFALLTSLLLAVTWTPAIATLSIRNLVRRPTNELEQGGPVLRSIIAAYEWIVRRALGHVRLAGAGMLLIALAGVLLARTADTAFLPDQDEGAFVLDYFTRPGTSLAETDRILRHVEGILEKTPEVESYSRRTGARLALAITEPNTGDFLVKLRPRRRRSTQEVIDRLRRSIHQSEPALHVEFPGVLSDLIGDLTWSPSPVEIKIFSPDTSVLEDKAREIAAAIETIPGVVDVNDGLVVAGPSLRFHVRREIAGRLGITPDAIGKAVRTSRYGTVPSHVLEGDRIYPVRVLASRDSQASVARMKELPVRSPDGSVATLGDLAEIRRESGILERHREDLRQLVAVSARLSGIDLGHAIGAIRRKIRAVVRLPQGASVEFGGLYQQQLESFRNLLIVLLLAVILVFTVLLGEFRSFRAAFAIVGGAALALVGVLVALRITGTTLNIVSFLGAIIGFGIVAKNGILMLDYVDHLHGGGMDLREALVVSGRRRLRPVLMTSLTAFLGLLPLACGVGAGADMLRPLAIGVIGALCTSLLLSLVATPTLLQLMTRAPRCRPAPAGGLANREPTGGVR